MKTELEKSSMAFKLKDGNVILISDEDINEIATKLIIEMSINKQNRVYILKDTSVDKCNLLYKIVVEQKETMTKEVRASYFKLILEILKNNRDIEFKTLEEELKNKTNP